MISLLDKLLNIKEYLRYMWDAKTAIFDSSLFAVLCGSNLWMSAADFDIFNVKIQGVGSSIWGVVWGIISIIMVVITIYTRYQKARKLKIEADIIEDNRLHQKMLQEAEKREIDKMCIYNDILVLMKKEGIDIHNIKEDEFSRLVDRLNNENSK